MTDLPVWLQEIRDRVDKATEGPWENDPDWVYHWFRVTDGLDYVSICDMSTDEGCDPEQREANTVFIAHARADVPRLVELVGEMARVLGDVEFRLRDLPNPLMADIYLRGRVTDVLAKYREEAKSE